jgi:hypothetical protein
MKLPNKRAAILSYRCDDDEEATSDNIISIEEVGEGGSSKLGPGLYWGPGQKSIDKQLLCWRPN